MTNSPKYASFTYTLQPGEELRIERPGDVVSCLSASAKFKIGFDDSPLSEFQQGLTYRGNPFGKVRIFNDQTGANTVEIGIASGGIDDARLSLTGPVIANVVGGGDLLTSRVIVPVSARALVSPANEARIDIIVSNLGSETVWLGGADVEAFEGMPVAPGSAGKITTTGAVSAINQSVTSVALAILETTR